MPVRLPLRWAILTCFSPLAPEVTSEEQYNQSVDLWSMGCLLYFMLFQRPPFYSNDDDETERRAAAGVYVLPKDVPISPEVADLLSKLLEKDPAKRLTAEQALQHPWIVNKQNSVPDSPRKELKLSSEEILNVLTLLFSPLSSHLSFDLHWTTSLILKETSTQVHLPRKG